MEGNKNQVVCLVGSFDPSCLGHTTLFQKASELGDKLVVLVRSNAWLENNRGFLLLGEQQRKELVESIDYVDKAFITHHDEESEDQSVSQELRKMKPDVFAKLDSISIREKEVCEKIDCEMVTFKVESGFPSDLWLLMKYFSRFLFTKRKREEKKGAFKNMKKIQF